MKELVDLSHEILRAIQGRDRAALDRILLPDFVHLGAGGERIGRADFLEGIASASYGITDIGFEWIEVDALGPALAVVTGVQAASVTLDSGETLVARAQFTDVFEKPAGTWHLRLAHTVELP